MRFKHAIKLSDKQTEYDFTNREVKPVPEIYEWLKKTLGKRAVYSSKWGWKGRWRLSNSCVIFIHKQDAMLFKLRWGGQ